MSKITAQYDMTGMTKVETPNVANIMCSVQNVVTILGDYPCDNIEVGDYDHQFIIYDHDICTSLDGIATCVIINNPRTFTGSTHTIR